MCDVPQTGDTSKKRKHTGNSVLVQRKHIHHHTKAKCLPKWCRNFWVVSATTWKFVEWGWGWNRKEIQIPAIISITLLWTVICCLCLLMGRNAAWALFRVATKNVSQPFYTVTALDLSLHWTRTGVLNSAPQHLELCWFSFKAIYSGTESHLRNVKLINNITK